MFKLFRWTAALGAALLVAACVASCGGDLPSDAVVQVGGQPITKAAFNHWMEVAVATSTGTGGASKPVVPEPPAYVRCIANLKAGEPQPVTGRPRKSEAALKTQCEQQYKALEQTALGFLISADWYIGEAEELGIKLTDKEVVQRFNQLKKQGFHKEGEFARFLTVTGQTVSDLLLRVKLGMLTTKTQEKVTQEAQRKVNEAAVTKYYDEHKSLYTQPERRNLRIVLTKTEAAAKQAEKEIESGKSFASVAKSKSIESATKNNGGELTGVAKGQQQKALSEAVFAAKQGVLGGPIKTPFGYYVYEVVAIHPATAASLAQVRQTAKAQLSSLRQSSAFTNFVKSFERHWTERTDCRPGYVVQHCKQYKAPPGAASAPTEAGAAATPAG
jgi:foldase protein PrsA